LSFKSSSRPSSSIFSPPSPLSSSFLVYPSFYPHVLPLLELHIPYLRVYKPHLDFYVKTFEIITTRI
jgi:hypothetical protein